MVGIRIPTWATFTGEVYSGFVEFMRIQRQQWQLQMMLETDNDVAPVNIDKNWRGDGLIVFRYTSEEASAWLKRGIRVVNLSSECLHPKIPTIGPDNEEMGRLAARHLMSLNLKHFAFWEDSTRRYSEERRIAFSEELAKAGFECLRIGFEISKTRGLPKWEAINEWMDRVLPTLPQPIGIFAKDDIAALSLVNACHRLGIQVPWQVAVLGCNDDYIFCHTANPPLSSVPYPGRAIGFSTAEMLAEMLEKGTQPPARTLLPISGVVSRESTGILLHSDAAVRKALAWIREKAPVYPLRVNELLEHIRISRSVFQTRFLNELGVTPKQEINRVRLERLQELLAASSAPLRKIAENMGFESQEDLARFFRRMTGMKPTQYRQTHHQAHSDRSLR